MKLAVRACFSLILAAGLVFGLAGDGSAQKIETVDGVKVVHNPAAGKWGKTPPVSLQPVRVIGDVDTDDENVAFNRPNDLEVDAEGRLYVLDSMNHRIQVFDRDGKFIKSIGRRGQGPGEFNMPSSISLDASGNLYVVEAGPGRVQVFAPDGALVKTLKMPDSGISNAHVLSSGGILSAASMGAVRAMRLRAGDADKIDSLPALVKVFDAEGKSIREFGKGADFGDPMVNDLANNTMSSLGPADSLFLVFPYQNRVEKFSPDGTLLWRSDRELPYSMEIKGKADVDRKSGGRGQTMVSIKMPQLTRCATGAAADAKGRLWVATMGRQLRENERVQTSMTVSNQGGVQTSNSKTTGAVDLRTTDAFKLEVYDADGVLLGSIPVGIFVDGIFIKGDRLFLIDRDRGVQIHEFKIVE